MRTFSRFARGLPILFGGLTVAAMLALPAPLQAQTRGESTSGQAQSRYLAEEDRGIDPHGAFLGLAAQYTEAVIVGVLAGGLLMNRLVGGGSATMAGAAIGTAVACWLTLRQTEERYIAREIR